MKNIMKKFNKNSNKNDNQVTSSIYELHQNYEHYARSRSEEATINGFLEWITKNDYIIYKDK